MIRLTAEPGHRLDQFLAARLPEHSRSRLQDWIRQKRVTVDGAAAKASLVLRGGESLVVEPGQLTPLKAEAEAIPLEILYEDDALVAVNKAAGMTVHSGAGVHSGTLVNALLHRYAALSQVNGGERPGIVHRLDRFTSGVLLVARNDAAHRALAAQFADREVEKHYLALVHGVVERDTGRVERGIARHHVQRFKMAVSERGRQALTEWRVERRFAKFTLLDVRIGTGRTHQIRVHLASLRHPVAGDSTYGAPPVPEARFFLHAAWIRFRHPVTGQPLRIEAPLPAELSAWLARLGD
jgi:23S rRNA pseudouridine1911/1915/1917 synthase